MTGSLWEAQGIEQEQYGEQIMRFCGPATVALVLSGLLSGCAMQQVQPWEKNVLARDEMQLTPDRIEEYLDGHIYSSREAASGGKGVGGGGCGCN